MNTVTKNLRSFFLPLILLLVQPAWAQNAIESLGVSLQGSDVVLKLTTSKQLAAEPASFSVTNPPRIAFDFPGVSNALGRNAQTFNEGDLRSINLVQVGDRSRLVLNLKQIRQAATHIEGRNLLIVLSGASTGAVAKTEDAAQRFAEARPSAEKASIRDINFRRGNNGEGRVVVDLSENNVGIDIRQQGPNLVVEFMRATLPDALRRRLDVADFATPITSVNTQPQGDNIRMVIAPKGLWEHNAYQSDNQFVVEVKQLIEDPNKLVQGSRRGYQGEKLSLNFQNIDVRAVLQVIADFTDFNIITSDTVGGSLTLRLKDVPWDQALDIILQAKGLDMRKNGNVIWIAPRDELAAKEKLQLESRQQITDLEPVRTETFQLNYHKAKTVFDFLKNKDQTALSKRGSVIVDERTNKLFVTDVPSRLEDVRRLISEIDLPARQVMIEARIVEAEDSFTKNVGVRFGFHDNPLVGRKTIGSPGIRYGIGGGLADTGFHTGQTSTTPDFITNASSVNLPATAIAGKQAGQFSLVLFNSAATRFLNLELSALEADGKGKIISSPRVVTADQVEALIEQGVEIPYQQATSSGATSISFRKANLALKVKPQITPDGRVNLTVDVNKDSPNTQIATGAGVAIDTKHVKTEVLVENGGTVVIGGIYTQDERSITTRVPVLGDLPYVGFLFKTNEKKDNKTELLVFITPKIISDSLSMR
ncbi:MAG: type IV pilus secretin PilQ [Rhodocyclaceae bacterium]|nr:type IV pilus secretin PilQ [Rhodocyclaceae bacterium]MCO5096508.1 type IV pilus secretin PilQ [Rhodocyclaceae bacterium]